MRAALTWLTERDATESALRLAGGLLIFWFLRGHLREGVSWLTRTLERAPEAAVEERIWALFGAGLLSWAQGDGQQAETLGRQSLALAREHEWGFGTGISFYLLFLALDMQGRMDEALAFGEQSVTYLREAGNRTWLAFAVGDLGLIRAIAGDGVGGSVLIDEGLALHREVGNKQGVGNKLSDLGWLRLSQKGRSEAIATRHFMESVRLLWEGGDVWYLANPVAGIAVLVMGAGATGRAEQAARLLGAATTLWERSGSTIPPTDRAHLVQAESTARAKLGEAAYAREAAIGQTLTVAEIVAEATAVAEALLNSTEPAPTPEVVTADTLSRRELDVLRLLAEGKSNPEIATALFIGRGTVNTHVSNILAKLGAKSRTEATTIAHRRGLV
jgi:ATP/maltotriose-dependent transcriptional regulator MalT